MVTAGAVSQTAIERVRLAGCPVDCLSFDETISELCRRIDLDIRTHVLFINAAKLVGYHQHRGLRPVIERAELLLADGVPIVWASRLLGCPLPGRCNGTDLMEAIVSVCADRGYRVFFLGATEEVVEATVAEFRRRHPTLKVTGYRNGYFSEFENDSVISEINRSGANLLLVGMSSPKKELWVDTHLHKLHVSVVQGVGGSFDVIAGAVKRAPRWMQRAGLEWFYRFTQEPRRMWRRYLKTNLLFFYFVGKFLVSKYRPRASG